MKNKIVILICIIEVKFLIFFFLSSNFFLCEISRWKRFKTTYKHKQTNKWFNFLNGLKFWFDFFFLFSMMQKLSSSFLSTKILDLLTPKKKQQKTCKVTLLFHLFFFSFSFQGFLFSFLFGFSSLFVVFFFFFDKSNKGNQKQ